MSSIERLGVTLLRYALVAILIYFGVFTFTMAEALSRLIGVAELSIAALILLRPWRPFWSAMGSLAAVGMFLITLSFLVTTPGLWQWVEGFPAPTEGAAATLAQQT